MTEYTYKVTAAGRINIIGEHIDYCGGKVMPAALSLKNTVYVRPNGTNKINLSWTTLEDRVTLDIDKLESYRNLKYGNYQAGAALMWQKAGHNVIGCDMLQDCTVPFGSGLSSSAAIEVSTIAALATLAGEQINHVEIALAAQKAEREYAGVNCGIMDQYASACGKQDFVMLLDCNSVTCEYLPLRLGDYALVIINCNKPHNLVDSKYNERREEVEQALRILQTALPVSCLAEVTEQQFEKYGSLLHGKVYDRCKHVVEECARVNKAAIAMKNGDIKTLGTLLNASHKSLKELYEVTGKELDALAAAAQSHPACVGSRMTGAGFGGCTVSLVRKDGVEQFKQAVAKEYKQKIGYDCKMYDAEIADGITVTKL
ncbi:MAG: galactokinase [Clostridiales bacterium]|nr:galactokinase [Clostridiales bacterium]